MSSEREDIERLAEQFASMATKQQQDEQHKLEETTTSRHKVLNNSLLTYHSTVHDAEEIVRTVRKEKGKLLGELNRLSREQEKMKKRQAREKAARRANEKRGGGSAFAGVDESSQLRQDFLLAKHEVDLKRKTHGKLVMAKLETLHKREHVVLEEVARIRALLLKQLAFTRANDIVSGGAAV